MWIRRLFALFLGLAIVVVVTGFFLPRVVTIERSVLVEYPQEAVFEVLQDFRHFTQWSPWFERVPDAGFRLEGPAAGVGSTLVWTDEAGSGQGRLWIVATDPPRRVDLQLELGDTEAEGFFVVRPVAEGGQRITWGLRVEVSTFDLVGRYIGLILPALVGSEYAEGLDRLVAYLDRHNGRPPVPSLPEEATSGS